MAQELPPRILTLDEILAAPDIKEDTVNVPEWGGAVKVKSFTKAQQQEIREASRVDGEIDSDRLEMFMLIGGVSDPVLTNESYEQLRQKSSGAIDRVLSRILKLSGLTPEAVDTARAAFSD